MVTTARMICMDEEEMLQRITRLLEQGCTMLATHHSCGAPLFRCRGEIVCPVCSFVEGQSALSHGKDQGEPSRSIKTEGAEDKDAGREGAEETSRSSGSSRGGEEAGTGAAGAEQDETDIADLRRSVLRKLRALSEGMEQEQDLDRLRKQLDCIEGALKVLRSMER
jgi:UPF0148 protein